MEINKKIEFELRTQIDNQFGARVECEDWERLQKENLVIKAALIAMKNIYDLAKSEKTTTDIFDGNWDIQPGDAF